MRLEHNIPHTRLSCLGHFFGLPDFVMLAIRRYAPNFPKGFVENGSVVFSTDDLDRWRFQYNANEFAALVDTCVRNLTDAANIGQNSCPINADEESEEVGT